MPFNPQLQHGFNFNQNQSSFPTPTPESEDRKLGTYGTAGPNGPVSSGFNEVVSPPEDIANSLALYTKEPEAFRNL